MEKTQGVTYRAGTFPPEIALPSRNVTEREACFFFWLGADAETVVEPLPDEWIFVRDLPVVDLTDGQADE